MADEEVTAVAQAPVKALEPTGPLVDEKTGRPMMTVKVYAPFEVFFEGNAFSVSAVNAVGPFDVLPRHHNFLCMLAPCNVVVDTPEGKKSIHVSRALMHVKVDHVTVFVDV